MNEGGAVYERRVFPRFELPEGQLTAELGIGGSRATATIVRDISLGGVKLDVPDADLDNTVAGICAVRFLNGDKTILPAAARGRIRRVDRHDGHNYVAIEFAMPLEAVGGLNNGAHRG